MSLFWYEEDTHVTDVRIFKSHDDHLHEDNVQCRILFQVTDCFKTDGVMIRKKRSMLAPVRVGLSPSQLSSLDCLFDLINYSVLISWNNLFRLLEDLDSKTLGLAKEITGKIMSRFIFNPTISCSNIIIAVNLDRICTRYLLQVVECNHHAVPSRNNDGADMDDDDGDGEDMDHDDNNGVDLDHENDNHDDNNDDDLDHEDDNQDDNNGVDLDHEDDNHDDNNDDDLDLDHENDNHDDNNDDDLDHEDDNNDDEYQHNNSFSGFGEDCFSEFEGFSEVTGLVDVKPHEVLKFTDCCSICLEEYGSDFSGVAKAEHCSHMFHKDCIQPWLRKSSNCCPLCRSVFIARI